MFAVSVSPQHGSKRDVLDIYIACGAERFRIGTVYYKTETDEVRFALDHDLATLTEARYTNVPAIDGAMAVSAP